MILFEKALQIVLDSARETGIENVDIDLALNRILAQDVISDMDMPPFNKSAMDGYACRREDILNELGVVETIPAGYVPRKSIHKNECAKIMTGAIVPPGADCVIKVEDTENITTDTIRFTVKALSRTNICKRAENIKKDDIVLRKGEILKPQHIAILAMVGCTT
ncbi:molybdopterin molybdenumtransferase MoeA, partial [Candidatus Latescibacterota bacterium]